jgi:hypothetical protein
VLSDEQAQQQPQLEHHAVDPKPGHTQLMNCERYQQNLTTGYGQAREQDLR